MCFELLVALKLILLLVAAHLLVVVRVHWVKLRMVVYLLPPELRINCALVRLAELLRWVSLLAVAWVARLSKLSRLVVAWVTWLIVLLVLLIPFGKGLLHGYWIDFEPTCSYWLIVTLHERRRRLHR